MFPTPETEDRTIISIPEHSNWGPGLHWHEAYTEHIRILRGRARITVNGVTKIYGPSDGVVTFEKFDVHDFSRADANTGQADDGPLEVMEWTDLGKEFHPSALDLLPFLPSLSIYNTNVHSDN